MQILERKIQLLKNKKYQQMRKQSADLAMMSDREI